MLQSEIDLKLNSAGILKTMHTLAKCHIGHGVSRADIWEQTSGMEQNDFEKAIQHLIQDEYIMPQLAGSTTFLYFTKKGQDMCSSLGIS